MGEVVINVTGMNGACIRAICLRLKQNKKNEAVELFNKQQQSMLENVNEANFLLDIMKMANPEAFEAAMEAMLNDENEDETSPW